MYIHQKLHNPVLSQVMLHSYVKLCNAQLRYQSVKEEGCFGELVASRQVRCGFSQAGKNCGSVTVFCCVVLQMIGSGLFSS